MLNLFAHNRGLNMFAYSHDRRASGGVPQPLRNI